MLPEAALIVALLIVFMADLVCPRVPCERAKTLSILTILLLVGTLAADFFAEPVTAFGGMYVTSNAVNLMKIILTAGTIIVVIMAHPWIEHNDTNRRIGEFYELILSTLLGMYMMMSSGHFLMFFLGLEMASVPLACL